MARDKNTGPAKPFGLTLTLCLILKILRRNTTSADVTRGSAETCPRNTCCTPVTGVDKFPRHATTHLLVLDGPLTVSPTIVTPRRRHAWMIRAIGRNGVPALATWVRRARCPCEPHPSGAACHRCPSLPPAARGTGRGACAAWESSDECRRDRLAASENVRPPRYFRPDIETRLDITTNERSNRREPTGWGEGKRLARPGLPKGDLDQW